MKPSTSCDNCDKSYYGDISTHITSGGGYVTGLSGAITGGGSVDYVISGGGVGSSGYALSGGAVGGAVGVGYRSNTAGLNFYGMYKRSSNSEHF